MTTDPASSGEQLESARRVRAELREAILGLERSLAAPSPGRVDEWAKPVRASVEFLRVSFRDHLTVTEGPNGLYEEIQTIAARLGSRITVLLREHVEIAAGLEVLMELVDAPPTTDESEWVSGVRERATAVLSMLVKHRQRGADLVYEAYDSDIGGES